MGCLKRRKKKPLRSKLSKDPAKLQKRKHKKANRDARRVERGIELVQRRDALRIAAAKEKAARSGSDPWSLKGMRPSDFMRELEAKRRESAQKEGP
jgi:hypothetical protein